MANNSNKTKCPVEIVCTVLRCEDNVESVLYKTLAMLNISRAFDSQSVESAVGGIISLYSLMSQSVLDIDKYIRTILFEDNINIKKIEIERKDDIVKNFSYPDEESQKNLMKHLKMSNTINKEALIQLRVMPQIFKDRFRSLNFDVSGIAVYTGLCLILICKKLNKYNYITWLNNKWETLFEAIGVKKENMSIGPNKSLFPRLKVCKDIFTFFSKHRNLKRMFYLSVMKLSYKTGIWSNICRTVLKLTKGTGMNHICLINTYILQDHPEIVKMNELKEEVTKLSSAFEIFETINLPEEQWPFLKIMNVHSCEKLDKNNFPLLTYIAVQIGKRTQSSLSGYTSYITSKKMKKVAGKVLNSIFKENSVTFYNKFKLQTKNSDVTKEDPFFIEFKNLFRISDILEKSLHHSLGINHYNSFDTTINFICNTVPTTKIIYISFSNDADLKMINIVSILSILRIYEGNNIENIIGGVVTLINFFCMDVKNLIKPFKEHGFELIELVIESRTDIMRHIQFADEDLNMLVLKYLDDVNVSLTTCEIHELIIIKKTPPDFKSNFLNAKINFRANLSYTGICLTLLFKQLSAANYPNWINHKWETFCRVLQISPDLCMPCSSLIPNLNVSQNIYSFFSTKFSIRKKIFLTIMELSESEEYFSIPSLVIGQLAKATEMVHIFLINDFINNHPIFMKMRELKPELLRYLSTIEAIQNTQVPERYWPFFKIISNPASIEFLNIHQFPTLLYLAKSFKAIDFKENYAGGEIVTPEIESIKELAVNLNEIYPKFSCEENCYFKLNTPNQDLLSSIEDVRLQNLFVISKILKACKEGMLGKISEVELIELKNLSIEDVKNKLSLLIKPTETLQMFFNLFHEL